MGSQKEQNLNLQWKSIVDTFKMVTLELELDRTVIVEPGKKERQDTS